MKSQVFYYVFMLLFMFFFSYDYIIPIICIFSFMTLVCCPSVLLLICINYQFAIVYILLLRYTKLNTTIFEEILKNGWENKKKAAEKWVNTSPSADAV